MHAEEVGLDWSNWIDIKNSKWTGEMKILCPLLVKINLNFNKSTNKLHLVPKSQFNALFAGFETWGYNYLNTRKHTWHSFDNTLVGRKLRLLSWKDTKGLTIWLSLVRAKSNEFALLPGHVLYREPGGHEIGGQKSHLLSWSNTQIKIVAYHSWVNIYIENSNDSKFFLYLAPDSSPKGPHPYGVIQPKRYMDESFCIETITLIVHINTNDSNFLLYRGPDSSPKGPYAPWLIYSAEKIHEWTFLHWNYYMLEFTKTPMTATFSCTGAQTVAQRAICPLTDLFSRTDTWMNLFALKLLHVGVHKNTNDSNFLLYRGPDSSPKGPYAP